MADINEVMSTDDEAADKTDIEGDTEYLHNVVDRGEEGEPDYKNPNEFDDDEAEAETIAPEPSIEELAKEPTEEEAEEENE